MLKHAFIDYFHYLQIERGLAHNTLEAYRRDLQQYKQFIKSKNITEWKDVQRYDIVQFLSTLKEVNKSPATISRTISAIRSFHQFLVNDQIVPSDVSIH